MKVLIIYASSGAGHFKSAEAIYTYLKKNCPAAKLELVDVLDKTSPIFRFNYTSGYSLLVNQAKPLWLIAFWFTEVKALRFLTRRFAGVFDRLNTRKFSKFLIQKNPDVIVSTHFIPSEIASMLKKENKIKARLITVITDFDIHPFWISGATDTYIVATSVTKDLLVKHGIDASLIKDTGIPVHPKFLQSFNRPGICKKLKIDPGKFTVLVATGSFGFGPIEEIVESLYNDVQVLVVCAGNKKLYKRLKAKQYPRVLVFGLVNNMEELMSVSDLIITKPGGLTISETLSMELIPVFISAIPGQESGNVEVLQEYGIGLNPKSVSEIKDIVLELKDNPEKYNLLKESMRQLKKPDCLKEICNVICQDSTGPAC